MKNYDVINEKYDVINEKYDVINEKYELIKTLGLPAAAINSNPLLITNF